MTIKNLTPHVVNVIGQDGTQVMAIEPEATPARLVTRRECVGDLGGIPINTTKFGEVTGLPEEAPGVYYVVALAVANAYPERRDLLITDDAVRDESGRVVGCRAFAQVTPPKGPTGYAAAYVAGIMAGTYAAGETPFVRGSFDDGVATIEYGSWIGFGRKRLLLSPDDEATVREMVSADEYSYRHTAAYTQTMVWVGVLDE